MSLIVEKAAWSLECKSDILHLTAKLVNIPQQYERYFLPITHNLICSHFSVVSEAAQWCHHVRGGRHLLPQGEGHTEEAG